MTLPKRKLYFTFVTSILLLAVITLIIYPSAKKIKEISDEINNQNETLEKLRMEGQFFELTKKRYESLEPKISEFSKIFIVKNQELRIITTLENVAAQNNLEQKIDLKEPKKAAESNKNDKKNEYQTLPLNIKINGTYPNFIKYLIDLETLDYYININSFRVISQGTENFITTNSQPANKNNISILLDANVYRIP